MNYGISPKLNNETFHFRADVGTPLLKIFRKSCLRNKALVFPIP